MNYVAGVVLASLVNVLLIVASEGRREPASTLAGLTVFLVVIGYDLAVVVAVGLVAVVAAVLATGRTR